jgi:hypothetical protein
MTLFVLVTGGIGESYERCYVWAHDRAHAFQLAWPICQAKYHDITEEEVRALEIHALFDASAAPFCSPLSDSGFDETDA